MRSLQAFAAGLAILLSSAGASAAVTEPDGKQVPVINSNSAETSLATFFAGRNESIDWFTDARAMPVAFYPVPGLRAAYVLNQAATASGLSWYNETGAAPAASDLHVLVPAGSAVGTTVTGSDIVNDAAYTGGRIGFALVGGGQTHYTNASYETVCPTCDLPGPWIAAIMYASTVSAYSYYVCFEDLPDSAGSFGNDGDFNDDVFLVTGISSDHPDAGTTVADAGGGADSSAEVATDEGGGADLVADALTDASASDASPSSDGAAGQDAVASADGSSGDDGGGSDASPVTDGQSSEVVSPDLPKIGGCQCDLANEPTGSRAWMWGLAVLVAARRRRRRG
jgi:MYXO-CTERM domain-containing protein